MAAAAAEARAEAVPAGVSRPRAGTTIPVRCRGERGMVSAEWAVGIIAAIGIAGVLLAVVTNGAVQNALLNFILWVINSFSGMMLGR